MASVQAVPFAVCLCLVNPAYFADLSSLPIIKEIFLDASDEAKSLYYTHSWYAVISLHT